MFYPKTYEKCRSLNFVHEGADKDIPVSFRPTIQLKKAVMYYLSLMEQHGSLCVPLA